MSERNHFVPIVITIALLFLVLAAAAEEHKSGEMDTDAIMAEYMKISSPNENHKLLDQYVGKWKAETKSWWDGPQSEPVVSEGKAEFSWIFGGRYLKQDYEGEMMGEKFIGLGYTGYDNFKKRFNSLWIDDMSTAMGTMLGSYNPEKKTFIFFGTMDEPMTGERDKQVKYMMSSVKNGKFTFEIHDLNLEEYSKVLEITYSRL